MSKFRVLLQPKPKQKKKGKYKNKHLSPPFLPQKKLRKLEGGGGGVGVGEVERSLNKYLKLRES